MPQENIKKVSKFFIAFSKTQQFSGVLLLLCTLISLFLANFISTQSTYLHTWHQQISFAVFNKNISVTVEHIINDGFMTLFFLLVGLEIKREIMGGELAGFNKAALPVFAAIGGMIVPAFIYFLFNSNTATAHGWGIPMATDIAFVIGVMALLGDSVPPSIKVLLTALAVADDIGAIIVIAVFYATNISSYYLIMAGVITLLLFMLNYFKVYKLPVYLFLGSFLWYFIYKSGIHATIAGVILAFTIPYKVDKGGSPLLHLEHFLQSPVSYLVMPFFVLCNTAIIIGDNFSEALFQSHSIGIILGLLIGKPLGIFLMVGICVLTKISPLPYQSSWRQIIGGGFLAGIGFTMSVFIALIAFQGVDGIANPAKIAILIASLLSGLIGFFLFKTVKN